MKYFALKKKKKKHKKTQNSGQAAGMHSVARRTNCHECNTEGWLSSGLYQKETHTKATDSSGSTRGALEPQAHGEEEMCRDKDKRTSPHISWVRGTLATLFLLQTTVLLILSRHTLVAHPNSFKAPFIPHKCVRKYIHMSTHTHTHSYTQSHTQIYIYI